MLLRKNNISDVLPTAPAKVFLVWEEFEQVPLLCQLDEVLNPKAVNFRAVSHSHVVSGNPFLLLEQQLAQELARKVKN